MSDSVQAERALHSSTTTHHSAALLQCIVETARGVFGAAASSIFILDPEDGSLVFGAVTGAGAGNLVGKRFPLDTGIAGWIVRSHESVRLDNLAGNAAFSREAGS